MTDGQWRVLLIVLALLGVEVFTSDTAKGAVKSALSGHLPSGAGVPQAAIGFTLGGFALVLIAAWQDGFATALALLLLVLVLINRSEELAPLVSGAADAIGNITGKGNSSSNSSNSK